MNRCKNCGQLLGDDEKFCPSCGTKVEAEVVYEPKYSWEEKEETPNYPTKICPKCGAKIHIDAVICPKCGCEVAEKQNVEQSQPTAQPESSTLGTLAIIFGALGGWLGLILSIIGLITYKEEKNRKKCKIGLGLFFGWIALYILFFVFIVALA